MKKVLIPLIVVVVLGALGALAYFALTMDDGALLGNVMEVLSPASEEEKGAQETQQPSIGKKKAVESKADTMKSIDYELEQNRDTVGWLRVPNTEISDSVVQSHDNMYYLRRNERRESDPSGYGCYFADYECSFGTRDQLSKNTIIYGHSDLKDDPGGVKFSQLFHFTDEQFARENPYIYFSTKDNYMTWQIFAVFYTDTNMAYTKVNFKEEQLAELVEEARSKSIYNYNVEVDGTDNILTLSTCTVKYGSRTDQRFVIMAKLVPEGEKAGKTADLTVNPSPVQPKFE